MFSIAELAHKRDPKAITEIICQELQSLGIDRVGVEVDIVDSSLELQIRTDSAIDKEKLLTLVHRKLQNLHIESVAKFRIHCWRNDEEMHEQRLLWTEQFMLEMPKPSPNSFPVLEPELDRVILPETRSPEPQLSKHSVLQKAIEKIAPTNHQAQQLSAANLHQQQIVVNSDLTRSASALTTTAHRYKPQSSASSDSNYWQFLFVGLSIVALGLGIGVSVRAITSKASIESSPSSPLATSSVENTPVKNTTATSEKLSSQTGEISATTTPTVSKANPSSSIGSAPNANVQEQEQALTQVVTLEKFNRIQKGMTIEQVNKVLGTSGKVIAENSSVNNVGKVYSWKNPEGSNAIIEFKNGQVVAKAQAGL